MSDCLTTVWINVLGEDLRDSALNIALANCWSSSWSEVGRGRNFENILKTYDARCDGMYGKVKFANEVGAIQFTLVWG